jgi:hypothetical protein
LLTLGLELHRKQPLDDVNAYRMLGLLFRGTEEHQADAIRFLWLAARKEPGHPLTERELGRALMEDEYEAAAMRYLSNAVRLNPDDVEARVEHASALAIGLRLAEARPACDAADRLLQLPPGPNDDPERLNKARSKLAETKKFIDLLTTRMNRSEMKARADLGPEESVALAAYQAANHGMYRRAASLAGGVAAGRGGELPAVPSDLRLWAAKASLAAGRGQGKDAADLDAQQKAQLRGQGLRFLRSDRERLRAALAGGDVTDRIVVIDALVEWERDPVISSFRDPAVLAGLPAAEREEWQAFWDEFERLQAEARLAASKL